jgi:PEGA domain
MTQAMLSKRAAVVSADKAFAKRLATGLQAAGASAAVHPGTDDLARNGKLDLVVVHGSRELERSVKAAQGALADGASIVVVIPSSSLETTVRSLQLARVAAVLVADHFEPAQLARVASRLLYGDLFGLEKNVAWGVKVHTVLVGDYNEKSAAIAQVSQFAADLGVRKKYRDSIEQCLDEMLMNALYDAPVDAGGKPQLAEVSTKTRISLRMEQKAVVQYACDGDRFTLSVRDSYGTLKGETVVRFLDKCLHAQQQIDRKTGGAGLGLYLIANSATQFVLSLHPGVATEATCTFDLDAPKVQLKELGIFVEKAGRPAVSPTRALVPASAPPSKLLPLLLAAAIAVIAGLIVAVAWPRLVGAPRGAIDIGSEPAGAQVEIDGTLRGQTPVVIDDLPTNRSVKVAVRHPGYEAAVDVVTPSRETPTPLRFVLKAIPATLLLESTPSGATAQIAGRDVGVTPVTLTDLVPGATVDLTLSRPGYQPLTRPITVPAGGTRGQMSFALALAPGRAALRIDSTPPGAEIVQNGELLAGVKTPIADHIVQAGMTYDFVIRLPGRMPEHRSLTVPTHGDVPPLSVALSPGGSLTVESNVAEARVFVDDVPACSNRPVPLVACPLPPGEYRVRLTSARPFVAHELDPVKIVGDEVKRRIELGWVEAATADLELDLPGAPDGTRRAALAPGEYRVKVEHQKTGQSSTKTVRISVGRTASLSL